MANNSFQKSVFVFCSYMSFIVLLFKSKYLNFGNSKRLQQSITLQGQSQKGWVQFFVKILKAVTGGSQYVVFMFSVLSNGAMVSRKLNCVIHVG